jgi:hypothetical protein
MLARMLMELTGGSKVQQRPRCVLQLAGEGLR